MIRQQPEGHDTFASGDSCFCAAKVAPVALFIITVSVNWLSDKRYWCVMIKPQIGPLSRTEQKSLWPQAVYRKTLTYGIIFTIAERSNSANQNLTKMFMWAKMKVWKKSEPQWWSPLHVFRWNKNRPSNSAPTLMVTTSYEEAVQAWTAFFVLAARCGRYVTCVNLIKSTIVHLW